MCGIGGFANFKQDFTSNNNYYNNILNVMTEKLERRGPDNCNTLVSKNACFAHSRLSIRDVKLGAQPMVSNCGNYTIVYNGEIYNQEELRIDLTKKGHVFNTTCDTETVLNLYIEYGEESPKMLNGIFAYVIYDNNKKRIFMCRDRFGVKPLYYTIKDNTLIFGSEIKALTAHPSVKLELDTNSFREIFGLFPSRSEGCGVFKGVHEIKFAAFGIFDINGFNEYNYWKLECAKNTLSLSDAIEQTRFLVTDSVKKQIVSDVPICTYLSGGLDSSVITGIIANEYKKDGRQLDTYSFDYEENSLYFKSSSFQVDEDKKWVGQMVKLFNTNHTYLECGIPDLVDALYKAVDAKDYPGMADIDSSLLYFSSLVSRNHKVTLTGECADEIFGGYPWFHDTEVSANTSFPWIRDMTVRKSILNEDFANQLQLDDYVKTKYNATILETPMLAGEYCEDRRRREITYLNMKWFMPTLLERMDRMTMYSSIEARVPYADHRLIEFLWNMPWDYKYGGTVKNLLREAFKDLLPHDLIYRKKSPYPKTYNPKYEQLLGIELKEILDNNNSPIIPLINKDQLLKIINSPKDYGKPWFGQLMAGPQLMAYYIQLDYWMKKYNLTC